VWVQLAFRRAVTTANRATSRPITPAAMPTVARVLAESTSSWVAVFSTVRLLAASPSVASASPALASALSPCSSSASTSVSTGAGFSGSSPSAVGSSIHRTISPLA
jgi:hypothetical protein